MRVNITFKASVSIEGDNLQEIAEKWTDMGITADGEDVYVYGIDYAENAEDYEDITNELIDKVNE